LARWQCRVSAVRHLVAHCRVVSIVTWHPTLPRRLSTSRPRLRAVCPALSAGRNVTTTGHHPTPPPRAKFVPASKLRPAAVPVRGGSQLDEQRSLSPLAPPRIRGSCAVASTGATALPLPAERRLRPTARAPGAGWSPPAAPRACRCHSDRAPRRYMYSSYM
jgi:hypothetical protein